jgi:hypothetical protein
MERETIKLSNSNWSNLVWENYIEIDGVTIQFTEVEDIYDGSRRHTEDHHKILKRNIDNKYFSISYETSVKDEMGWNECNSGEGTATEVFPIEKTIIIYK